MIIIVIRRKISGDQDDSNGSDGKWLASGFIYVCVKVFNVLLWRMSNTYRSREISLMFLLGTQWTCQVSACQIGR